MELGYSLMSEEHPPEVLLDNAERAQAAGFAALSVSDHFHPWLDEQGQSPFAWSVLAGLTQRVELPLTSLVTCPIRRYHPAVVAQMAATTARMAPGGLTLGLGTGEYLNEHVVGGDWPPPERRRDLLEEAVDLIEELLTGDQITYLGDWFTADRARLYTLPEEPLEIAIAASSAPSAAIAANRGHALVSVGPDAATVEAYRDAGGAGRALSQATVCWHEDERQAKNIFHQQWRQSAMGWSANAELPTPTAFAEATQSVPEGAVASGKPVGTDVDAYMSSLRQFEDAGFDLVFVHNVGPEQQGFLDWAGQELLPAWNGR